MHRQPENGALEPAVLERQRLRGAELERRVGDLVARDAEHLRGRIDAPDSRAPRQRLLEPAGAAADVEHAAAGEADLTLDQLEQRVPRLVGGAQNRLQLLGLGDVLRERDLDEARHGTASGSGAGSSASRACSAPPRTSAGEPRSSNGTSMTSKSFGTTVSAKIVRASRATSGPK